MNTSSRNYPALRSARSQREMVNEDRPSSSGGGGAVMDSSQEVSDSAREGADNAGEGAESGMISINVKLLGGGDFAMDVDRNIAISDLKTRVRERTEVEEVRSSVQFRRDVFFFSVCCGCRVRDGCCFSSDVYAPHIVSRGAENISFLYQDSVRGKYYCTLRIV